MSIQQQIPTPKRRTRSKAAPKETKDAQIARLQAQLAATQARLLSVEAEARAGNGLPAYSDTQLLHELEDRESITAKHILGIFEPRALIAAMADDVVTDTIDSWMPDKPKESWLELLETVTRNMVEKDLHTFIEDTVVASAALTDRLAPYMHRTTDIMHLADHADMGRWDVVCEELKRMISEAKFGA